MIIPALLTDNERIAKERIQLARRMSGWLHIDILDNTLYPFSSLGLSELAKLDFDDLLLEFHCMISNPLAVLEAELPVHRLILHYETRGWEKAYHTASAQGVDTWIAIAPDTKLKTVHLPDDVPGIVVMGVAPGQTGQSFISETYERIEAINDYYPDPSITIDGGVHKENIRLLIAHGVDNLVMGSALFSTKDPVATYEQFAALSDPIGGMYDHEATRTPSQ